MKKGERSKLTTKSLWLIGLLIVIILWFGSIVWFAGVLSWMSWSDRASIGDTFGAVNALFAGLAFVAVVITLYLQSQTIKDTREEQEQQSFENKFFQLLRIHNDIIEGIEKSDKTRYGNIIVKGRQRLKEIFDSFINDINGEYNANPSIDAKKTILKVFEAHFKKNEHELAHYFRNVYHIIAFIDRSLLVDEKKWEFIKLFRAQLSSHELLLIFYNGIWYKEGKGKFKPLMEKFALFEHMPKLELQDHRKFYDEAAFSEEVAINKFFPDLKSQL
jgi:uncharacterized membrane protein